MHATAAVRHGAVPTRLPGATGIAAATRAQVHRQGALHGLAPKFFSAAALVPSSPLSCTSSARSSKPLRMSVWPVAATAPRPELGSSPALATCKHGNRRAQRCRIDRSGDPHPRPVRKLHIDQARGRQASRRGSGATRTAASAADGCGCGHSCRRHP
jgi:hypothetical protein